ncbi:MAG: 3-oxoacyl-[acyl-carrier-protein] synthase [Solirubrobacteraceae bacterium]|jgi:3-oxoacyl-[acyl-carrier-protein] synthase-3|nr:3-oxoacyl-[acyl-carrier-protein] synthase [Solirubrobacteraceae bacterium]
MASTPEVAIDPAASTPPRLRTAGVVGLGTALPARVVPNSEVAAGLGVDDAWIVRRTGIRARRFADPGDTLVALATEAGRAAIEDSGLAPEDIDLVVVATLSHELSTPNAAPLIAHALGATRAGGFDLGCACTGFVAGLASASAWIESGRAQSALIIGAEIMSRYTDPTDKRTAALFGDGAGAVVITAGAPGQIGPIVLGADGACGEMITSDPETKLIIMDGHETFKQAVGRLAESSLEACRAAGVALADIDLYVYHQANGRITSALGERLGLDPAKTVDCIAELGNTSAASIPLALGHARANGQLQPGMRVLLAAVGAGFTWGAVVVEWGEAPAANRPPASGNGAVPA